MRISVVIPTYKRPAELSRALNALVQQEYAVSEVIVVARLDDLPTHRAAQEFSSVLPLDLQFVERPGMVESVNRGLDRANGEVISLIDDDAEPRPDWALKIARIFEQEPDLAGLGGRDRIFQNGSWVEGEAREVGIVHGYGRVIGNHHLGVGPRRNVDSLKGVNMSFRRSALGSLCMDERLRGTGAQCHCDFKLCLELRARRERLAYDPSVLVDHFPAPRHDEDQRNSFNALAYENQIHNLTLALLEYLRLPGRMLLLAYSLLIGIGNGYCGLLKGLLYCPRLGTRRAWQKTAASARGVFAAWKTWKMPKSNRVKVNEDRTDHTISPQHLQP